jgi:hypothetical protein
LSQRKIVDRVTPKKVAEVFPVAQRRQELARLHAARRGLLVALRFLRWRRHRLERALVVHEFTAFG